MNGAIIGIMPLSALLVLLSVHPAAVTFSAVAQPLPKLLTQLSPLVGKDLHCATSMKGDVVAVNFEGASADDVLSRIAKAECATWDSSSGQYWLTPDPQAERAAKQAYIARESTRLTAEFQKMAAQPDEDSADSTAAVMKAIVGSAGSTELSSADYGKVMLAIGAINVVDLGRFKRLVFSSNPDAMQLALPQKALTVVEGLVKKSSPSAADATQKVDVVVSSGALSKARELSIECFAIDGKRVASLNGYGSFDFASLMKPEKPTSTADTSPKLDLSPVAAATSKFGISANVAIDDDAMNLMGVVRDAVADPTNVDPLAYPSEPIVKTAQALHENLVAVLPDSVFSDGLGTAATTADACLKAAKANQDLTVTEDGGWITIDPAKFEDARTHRASRTFLASMVAYMKSHETPDLDSMASIAMHAEQSSQDLIERYIMLFRLGWLSALTGSFDDLSLYGNLSTSQRQLLASGSPVRLSSLSTGASDAVAKMIYTGQRVRVIATAKSANPFASLMEGMSPTTPANSTMPTDSRGEPTELCPNGVPADGIMTGRLVAESVYLLIPKDGDKKGEKGLAGMDKLMGQFPMTAQMVAMLLGLGSIVPQASAEMPKFDSIKPGTRNGINYRIQLGSGAFIAGQAASDAFDANASNISVEDFKKSPEYQKASEAMNKLMKSMMDGMGSIGGPKQKP